mgnify:CR=1 FL=1|tara:strand:- start:526 stop:750 length:225 start_codon:yes stop_codon:yes gene_type:complete
MNTITALFQAYMTVCMMDGYGNLHSCKTFTPKEGATVSMEACEKQIKDFQNLLQFYVLMPHASQGYCKDLSTRL